RRGLKAGRLDRRGPGDQRLPRPIPFAGRTALCRVPEGRRPRPATVDRADRRDGGARADRRGALMLDRTSATILLLAVLAAVLGGGLAEYRRHHALSAAPVAAPAPSAMVGRPLPALSLPDLEGRMHALADYRGRRLLINFWATWCGPCLEEMPALD